MFVSPFLLSVKDPYGPLIEGNQTDNDKTYVELYYTNIIRYKGINMLETPELVHSINNEAIINKRLELVSELMSTGYTFEHSSRLAQSRLPFIISPDRSLLNIVSPVIVLKMLWVPISLRNKGIASSIVSSLEKRADFEHKLLIVGPIEEDSDGNTFLGDMVRKRGYNKFPPRMWIRRISI